MCHALIVTKVSGYRTRSGKRVRGYTRSGGVSLGRLRHSTPKDPMMIAQARGRHAKKNLNLIRAGEPRTGALLHSLVGTPGHAATVHYKGRFGRQRRMPVEIISYHGGGKGLTYKVMERGPIHRGSHWTGRGYNVPHFSGGITRYRSGN